MFKFKKILIIAVFVLCGGVFLSQTNCYAHSLEVSFENYYYSVQPSDSLCLCGDYSLFTSEAFNYIDQFIGIDKAVEIDDMTLEKLKSIIIPLKKDLYYIDSHSDYNDPYTYDPGSEEMWERINKGYIELFKLIKTLV